jgi:hypothetical protein
VDADVVFYKMSFLSKELVARVTEKRFVSVNMLHVNVERASRRQGFSTHKARKDIIHNVHIVVVNFEHSLIFVIFVTHCAHHSFWIGCVWIGLSLDTVIAFMFLYSIDNFRVFVIECPPR